MGFIYEKYNNNYGSLIVSFQGDQNTENYFAGNNVQDAMEYFNMYLENGRIRIHTEEELALNETGVNNMEEAELLREQLNSITSSLTDEQATECTFLFPSWLKNKSYTTGTRVRYYGRLFKVLQNHTSQEGWEPTRAPSLFAEVLTNDDGTPAEWQQPSSTNPYLIGDKVIFNGEIYESIIDNNVWSPADYPTGWTLISSGEEPEPSSGEEPEPSSSEPEPSIPDWVQPSAGNPYMTGDRVMFNDSIYESTIDNNVWSPVDYPAGWQLIE